MIKIYNTMSAKLEEFKAIDENEVKLYVCGPTVYNYIHIGNARPLLFFDTVRRYFEYKGYKVKFVQNFTDIDDKMINRANEEGTTVKKLAEKYIKAYFDDTAPLNIKEEGMIRPKATENIKEMIKLVKDLIDKGFAYESNGDVYFNIESFKEYGKLSHQKVEDLVSGARIEVNENKRSPLDFTLWKKAKENEPMWGSPWGQGRPGWHLECSVMSAKYLGDNFDIHGGGQDLIFPHHENEIAQSECANGSKFANYWMHNGYLNIKGEKMSKSKGNFFLLREILKKYSGNVLRLFMLSAHYRKPIDFSEEELITVKTGYERIVNTKLRLEEIIKKNQDIENNMNANIEKVEELNILVQSLENTKKKFEEGMDEDFNTAIAIGSIYEFIKEVNKFLDLACFGEKGLNIIKESYDTINMLMFGILGIKLEAETKVNDNLTKELLDLLLDVRWNLKTNKNFEMADKIRNSLLELGIEIKDGRDKSTWKI